MSTTEGTTSMRSYLGGLPLAVCLLAGLLIAMWSSRLPEPGTASADASTFAADRAMAHVEVIAARPHPIGSPEASRARAYIERETRALGLEVVVQSGVGVSTDARLPTFASAGYANNVIATLPGRDRTLPSIVLMAHYDSVRHSPGAADDAIGVAAILETARALKTKGPHLRDVVLVFTDGEEPGLLGASLYFARLDKPRHRIGIILNFEARGDGGRAAMFETGPDSGNLVKLYGSSVSLPASDSLSATLYRLMPNNSDFTHALLNGVPGMNFAIADNQVGYHTMISTPAHLDRGSVQHMGDQALAFSAVLADAKSLPIGGGDLVYSDIYGSFLVHYQPALGWLPIMLSAALLVWGAIRIRKRDAFSISDATCGMGWFAILLVAAMLALDLAGNLTAALLQNNGGEYALLANIGWFKAGCTLLALGVVLSLLNLAVHQGSRLWACGIAISAGTLSGLLTGFSLTGPVLACLTALLLFFCMRRASDERCLWFGMLFSSLVLTVVMQLTLAPGAFILAWPVLAASAAFALITIRDVPSKAGTIIAGIIAAAMFAHVAAQGDSIFVAVGAAFPAIIALFSTLAAIVLFHPLQQWLRTRNCGAQGAAVIFMGLALAVLAGALKPNMPIVSESFYYADLASGRQYRASTLAGLDSWSRRVLEAGGGKAAQRSVAPLFHDKIWLAPTKSVAINGPKIEITKGKSLQIQVRPVNGARTLHIFIKPSAGLSQPVIEGRRVQMKALPGQWAEIRYNGATPNGVTLSFTAHETGSVEVRAVEFAEGWPSGISLPASRPSHFMPWQFDGMTMVAAQARHSWAEQDASR